LRAYPSFTGIAATAEADHVGRPQRSSDCRRQRVSLVTSPLPIPGDWKAFGLGNLPAVRPSLPIRPRQMGTRCWSTPQPIGEAPHAVAAVDLGPVGDLSAGGPSEGSLHQHGLPSLRRTGRRTGRNKRPVGSPDPDYPVKRQATEFVRSLGVMAPNASLCLIPLPHETELRSIISFGHHFFKRFSESCLKFQLGKAIVV
jgi:hypothetical protein